MDAEIKIEDIKPEYDIIDDFEYKPFFSNDVNNDEIYNAFWNSDVNSQNSEALIQSTEVLEPECLENSDNLLQVVDQLTTIPSNLKELTIPLVRCDEEVLHKSNVSKIVKIPQNIENQSLKPVSNIPTISKLLTIPLTRCDDVILEKNRKTKLFDERSQCSDTLLLQPHLKELTIPLVRCDEEVLHKSNVSKNVNIPQKIENQLLKAVELSIELVRCDDEIVLKKMRASKTNNTTQDFNIRLLPPECPERKSYRCLACNKYFSRLSHYEEHLRSHSGEKPYVCEFCNKSFPYEKSRKRHRKTVHKGKTPSNLKSKVRDKTKDDNNKLLQLKCKPHVKENMNGSHETTPKKSYTCLFCNKLFSRLIHYNEHIRTHTGEKPYVCDLCNKSFCQLGTRNKHRSTHNDKRLSMSLRSKLRRNKKIITSKTYNLAENNQDKLLQSKCKLHLKENMNGIHETTSKKSYTCSFCDKLFSRLNVYDAHIRTHTGEKPYVCDLCNKSFSQVGTRNRHRSTHNDKRLSISPQSRLKFK